MWSPHFAPHPFLLTSYHEYALLKDTVHSHSKVICTKIVGSFILFEYVTSNISRVNPRVEVLLLKLRLLFAVPSVSYFQ
jgi:hypothetical protein